MILKCFDLEQYLINAKIIQKQIFSFLVLLKQHKRGKVGKAKKEKLLWLIPENINDRKLSVCITIKYQLNIEKKA